MASMSDSERLGDLMLKRRQAENSAACYRTKAKGIARSLTQAAASMLSAIGDADQNVRMTGGYPVEMRDARYVDYAEALRAIEQYTKNLHAAADIERKIEELLPPQCQ